MVHRSGIILVAYLAHLLVPLFLVLDVSIAHALGIFSLGGKILRALSDM